MFFEKVINFFDYYHQNRIINYLKNFEIEYFIDIGAHKGEFLSYLLKLKPKKIYCFEPQKNIFQILTKKFNNIKNVELYNLGLAEKSTKKTFFVNKLSSTSTFSKSKNTFFSKFKKFILHSNNFFTEKYLIKTKKLDEIFKNKNIKDIFIKIDVEGFELNVLKGAINLLSKKIKFILVEKHFFQLYNKNHTNDVHLFLIKNNFKLIKKFTFPLLHFQDNLYIKNSNKN